MSQWLNHVAIAAPRNTSTTHTVTPSSGTVVAGTLFTPTASRLLVCVVEGAVTSTTPSGWTLPSGGSAINNTGLYVWYRSAAGSDSLTTTHNGSNYPVVFDFYEFPASTTWAGAVSATGVTYLAGAGPSLTGLTGTTQVYGVAGQTTSAARIGPYAGSWGTGAEMVDTSVAYSSTDGYTYGVTELVDYTSATASAAWTSTNAGDTVERLMWAVQVPAGGTSYAITSMTAATSTISVTTGLRAVVTIAATATAAGSLSPTLRAAATATTPATATISAAMRLLAPITVAAAAAVSGASATTGLAARITTATAVVSAVSADFGVASGATGYPITASIAATSSVSATAQVRAAATVAIPLTSDTGAMVHLLAAISAGATVVSVVTVTAVRVSGSPELDITVTATIDPRRWSVSLDSSRWDAALQPRRWEAS